VIEYLRVLRPDHWLKNVFVIFGHLVAIVLLALPVNVSLIAHAFFSLVPACLIASANYILNEILDAPFDRVHPTKRSRSVAAGRVQTCVLWILMGVLCVAGFVLATLFFNAGYVISLGLFLLSGVVYNGCQP